jgi:hypothetical protein
MFQVENVPLENVPGREFSRKKMFQVENVPDRECSR